MSTDIQNYGELLTRQVSTSTINAALDGSKGAGNKRDLTLTCSKDDNSSQLSLIFHHDDDGNGVDLNTATFSANTQIKGVLDPTNGSDVATKSYTDNSVGEVGVVTDTNRDQVIDTLELKHLIDPSGLPPQPGVGTSLKYISSISDQAEHEIGTVAFETLDDNPVVPGGTTTDADLNTNFNISNYKEGTKNLSLQSAYDGSLQIFGNQYLKKFNSFSTQFQANVTYDAAGLSRGFIFRNCNGASRTDTLPSASDIVDAFPTGVDGTSFYFSIVNISSGTDEDLFITVTGNVIINLPILENICIKPGNAGNFLGAFSGSRADIKGGVSGSIGIYYLSTTTWLNDANNNGISYPISLRHTTTGTPSTGIGVGLDFITETAANNQEKGMSINSVSTNVGGGTEAFDFVLNLMAGGAAASEVMRSVSDGSLKIAGSQLYRSIPAASIVDPNSVLYPIGDMLSGLIQRNCNGAARTDQVPTAVDIIAGIPNCQADDTFIFSIFNQSSGPDEIITLSGNMGNGVAVVVGNVFIKPGEAIQFEARIVNATPLSEIVFIQGLGAIPTSIFTITDTTDSDVSTAATLVHNLSSGTPTAGIGTGLNFTTQTTAGNEIGMSLTNVATNVGSGTEAFDFVVNLMAGGATASEVMRSSSDGYLKIANSQLYKNTSDIVDTVSNTIVVNADAINTTYTAAEVLSGFIVRNATATTMDILPTAESIVAAIPNCQIGDTFEFAIQNISTGGPGIDIMLQSNFDFSPPNSLCSANGNITIKQGEIRKFWAIVISNVATFRIAVYGLGIRDSISNGFFDVADTATNTVTNVIDLTHKLKSGSVATNGIGTGINFKSVLTDGSMPSLGSIEFVTMDATNTILRSSKIKLNAVNSGTEQQVFEVNSTGDIELGDANTPTTIYGRGTGIIFNSSVTTNEGLSANQTGSSATYNVSPFTVRGQTTSGTPSAGSATSIPYYMEVRAGVNKFLSRLKTTCTDNVVDEEKGDFVIELLNNTGVSGNAEEKFRTISDGNIQIQGPNLYKKQTGASITIAGPATYTAENILSGLIIRDCSGSSRTDTLITGLGPTGLVQNIPNAVVGTTFNLTIANISGNGEDITLQEVVNFAVIKGITTIKAGESMNAQIVVTDISGGAEKYTMYTLSSSSGGGGGSNGIFTVTDTVLNNVSIPVTLKHLISAGTIATGIGTGMNFVTETTAGEEIGMSLTSVSTNIGAGTEAFDFVLNLMAGGATASEALRVTSDKILTIPTGGDIFLPDNSELRFGDSATADVNIKFDTTNLLTTMAEGNNIIKFENDNKSLIIRDSSDNTVLQALAGGTTVFRKTSNSNNQ